LIRSVFASVYFLPKVSFVWLLIDRFSLSNPDFRHAFSNSSQIYFRDAFKKMWSLQRKATLFFLTKLFCHFFQSFTMFALLQIFVFHVFRYFSLHVYQGFTFHDLILTILFWDISILTKYKKSEFLQLKYHYQSSSIPSKRFFTNNILLYLRCVNSIDCTGACRMQNSENLNFKNLHWWWNWLYHW